jgi:hypothetical protein
LNGLGQLLSAACPAKARQCPQTGRDTECQRQGQSNNCGCETAKQIIAPDNHENCPGSEIAGDLILNQIHARNLFQIVFFHNGRGCRQVLSTCLFTVALMSAWNRILIPSLITKPSTGA